MGHPLQGYNETFYHITGHCNGTLKRGIIDGSINIARGP